VIKFCIPSGLAPTFYRELYQNRAITEHGNWLIIIIIITQRRSHLDDMIWRAMKRVPWSLPSNSQCRD